MHGKPGDKLVPDRNFTKLDGNAVTPTETRLRLLRNGYDPIPVVGKIPPLKGWPNRTNTSEGDIAAWEKLYPDAGNTGILTRRTPALDIDILDPDAADAAEALVRERFDGCGEFLVRFGKAPRRAILFRSSGDPFKKIVANLIAPNGSTEEKIELLANGQQVVVDGVHPDTGSRYRWFGNSPGETCANDLPGITEIEANNLIDVIVETLVRDHGYELKGQKSNTGEREDPAGWDELFQNIRDGRSLHDSLLSLADKLVKAGTNPGAVVNQLRALMEASIAPHDERWRQRYLDIPRTVDDAQAYLGEPHPDENPTQANASGTRKLSYFGEFGSQTGKRPILKGFLYRGEISSLIGPPKALKSALMAEIAVHGSAGSDWRNHRCKESCGVVIFALERADLYQRRFTAYQLRDNLPKFPIAVRSGVIDLLDPKCVGEIIATVREAEQHMGRDVGLIVFDTYSKGIAAGGGDENAAKDQNRVAANLRKVLELIDVHIATVGHTGKDQSRGERGSNARLGDVDVQVQIKVNDKIRVAEVTSANDQPERVLARFGVELFELGVDEDGEPETVAIISDDVIADSAATAKSRLTSAQSRALELLTRCINDQGRPPPPSNEYPRSIRVVRLDEWHTMCERGGLSSAETKDSRDRVFRRAKDELQTMHRIACLDGWVWLVRDFNGE